MRLPKHARKLRHEQLELRQLLAADIASNLNFEQPEPALGPPHSGLVAEGEGTAIGSQEVESNNRLDQANRLGVLQSGDRVFQGSFSIPYNARYNGLRRTLDDDIFEFQLLSADSLRWEIDTSNADFGFSAVLLDESGIEINRDSVQPDDVSVHYIKHLPAGTYYLQLDAGAQFGPLAGRPPKLSPYTVTLQKGATGGVSYVDTEPNDSLSSPQWLGTANLQTVSGTVRFNRPDRFRPGTFNNDVYSFEMESRGDLSVRFVVPASSISADLYDENDQLVLSGNNVNPDGTLSGNTFTLEANQLGAGIYKLRVSIYVPRTIALCCTTSRSYSFTLDGPGPLTPVGDREIESNDVPAEANFIGSLGESLKVRGNLAVSKSDVDGHRRTPESDFFLFDVEQQGQFRVTGQVDYFRHGIKVNLLDREQTLIQTFEFDGRTSFSHSIILAQGKYFLQVTGDVNSSASDVQPTYLLAMDRVAVGQTEIYNGREVEPNDSLSQANLLGNLETLLGVSGVAGYSVPDEVSQVRTQNPDYFAFTIDSENASDLTVSLAVDRIASPLRVSLLDASGNEVDSMPLDGTLANRFTTRNLDSGIYFIGITGANVDHGSLIEPNYDLTITRKIVTPVQPDVFDAQRRNETYREASILTLGENGLSLPGLTIHESGDSDFYRFQLDSEGTASDTITARFDSDRLDIDLSLFGPNGPAFINTVNSRGDVERLSLEGLAAGTYYVQALARPNQTGTYELSFSRATPEVTIEADRFEPNNSFSNATQLDGVEDRTTVSNLTLHEGSSGVIDTDYFEFFLLEDAGSSHSIVLQGQNLGFAQLELFNGSNQRISSSPRVLGLNGLSEGRYYLKVSTTASVPIAYQLSFTTPVRSDDFEIQYYFDSSVSDPRLISALHDARNTLQQIISGDQPDVTIPSLELPNGQVLRNVNVDDIFVYVELDRLESPGTLAQAGGIPRPGEGTPFLGAVWVNSDRLSDMLSNGSLTDVLTHELIHALTAPQTWQPMGLVNNATAGFTGANSVREYNELLPFPSATDVPLERHGGSGTAGAHWDEEIFGDELMTGYLGDVDAILSSLTIALLDDVGHEVDYSLAEPYSLPSERIEQHPDHEHVVNLDSFSSLGSRVIAPDVDTLFAGLSGDIVLRKVEAGEQRYAIQKNETQVISFELDGTGSAQNAIHIDSTLDRPFNYELKRVGGSTIGSRFGQSTTRIPLENLPAGRYEIEVTSSDNNFVTIEADLRTNAAPVIQGIPNQIVTEGSMVRFTARASDPESSGITYSLGSAPAGASIHPTTGAFSWTAPDGPLQFDVTVIATDGGSPAKSASTIVKLIVNNQAPRASLAFVNFERVVGTEIAFTGSAQDAAGSNDSLTYSYSVTRDNTVVASASGLNRTSFSFTPVSAGSHTITLTVRDDDGAAGTATLPINVSAIDLPLRQPRTLSTNPSRRQSFVDDVDGDGLDDFVTYKNGSWQVATSGVGDPRQFAHWSPGGNWDSLGTGDFNGDGRADIIGQTHGNWWVGISNGTGFRGEHWGYLDPINAWEDLTIADLNGDGKSDLVGRVTRDGGSKDHWWVLESTGNRFQAAFGGTWWHTSGWKDTTFADFNGDKKIDLARRIHGDWYVSSLNGNGFDETRWGNWGDGWTDVRAGDFNGDGNADIAGRSGGTWWVAQSDGLNFRSSEWGYWNPSQNWEHQIVADFNGDGKDDIAARNQGSWYYLAGDSRSASQRIGALNDASFDEFLTGDFDGDGVNDLLAVSHVAGINEVYDSFLLGGYGSGGGDIIVNNDDKRLSDRNSRLVLGNVTDRDGFSVKGYVGEHVTNSYDGNDVIEFSLSSSKDATFKLTPFVIPLWIRLRDANNNVIEERPAPLDQADPEFTRTLGPGTYSVQVAITSLNGASGSSSALQTYQVSMDLDNPTGNGGGGGGNQDQNVDSIDLWQVSHFGGQVNLNSQQTNADGSNRFASYGLLVDFKQGISNTGRFYNAIVEYSDGSQDQIRIFASIGLIGSGQAASDRGFIQLPDLTREANGPVKVTLRVEFANGALDWEQTFNNVFSIV